MHVYMIFALKTLHWFFEYHVTVHAMGTEKHQVTTMNISVFLESLENPL